MTILLWPRVCWHPEWPVQQDIVGGTLVPGDFPKAAPLYLVTCQLWPGMYLVARLKLDQWPYIFFEKCKVKSKCFHSFSRSEKWNQNASRSRSRSENSREFWTILEKRDFWTGWNQLVRKPGAEQGGGAHNCQWKRGEGDLFQAACTNDEQHLRTTINITNND